MEYINISYIATSIACIVIARWILNTLKWVWFEPEKLEKCLRKQGLQGNSYKFLFGDMKESSMLRNEALPKPMPFHNHYFPRINPFVHQLLNTYGLFPHFAFLCINSWIISPFVQVVRCRIRAL
ncbi:hypothetical protein RND81_08G154900 [Saponaria officinalis]|uniref:Cytochrome P450 n=1 Tax=Saponaria officinalis TaxID=3572 RepID=A0AAW1J742_SAPOF